jgi:23S rRNA pseudouridine1911/1915/1917 synthase
MPKIRLYRYLIEKAKEENWNYSNPEIKKNIENYGVCVDGVEVFKQLYQMYPEQRIEIPKWPVRQKTDLESIRVMYEDETCLVLFKPKGVVVEKGVGHKIDNLVTWLHQNYQSQKFQQIYSGLNIPESGLVHRLDKDTQGLIMVGKSLESWKFLQDQFRQREVTKKYLTVLDGCFDKVTPISNWQSRDNHNPRKQKFFWTETEAKAFSVDARFAESIFYPLYICPETNQSIVQVQIKTGRMHQIRIQAEALGFPLSDELLYNTTNHSSNSIPSTSYLSSFELKLADETNKFILSKEEFQEIQQKIFGNCNYSLLSNFLEILLPNQKLIKIELFSVAKVQNVD